MKQLFLSIIILILSAGEGAAQWKDFKFGSPQVFGVHDDTLFASQMGGGVSRYDPATPYPDEWVIADNGIASGITDKSVTAFGSIGNVFIAATNGTTIGIFKSTNDGSNWDVIRYHVQADCFATSGSDIFSGGSKGSGVWRSTNSGSDWVQMNSGLSDLNVTSLAITGINLFAGTSSGIFRSTDSGNSWSPTSVTAQISSLAVAGSVIAAGLHNGGIYRSVDGGNTWSHDVKGLLSGVITGLASDGKNFFAATGQLGVFLSTDSGQSWDTVNTGLPYLNMTTLCVFDTLLIAGAYDNASVYSYSYVRPISEMVKKDSTSRVVSEEPQASDSIEIYPNPSLGLVTILAGGTNVLGVSVMNVLGSETGAGVRGPGSGKVDLDLSKLPSGTYFLQIETAKGTVMRKVVRE
jgi:hypothetical protein